MKSRDKTTLLSRVWQAATQNPEKIIVYDSVRTWTWSDLLWRAQSYAEALKISRAELMQAPIIPIVVDRSGDTVAAILGTLIAGKGFAPISANQPVSRMQQCFSALNTQRAIVAGAIGVRLGEDGSSFPERIAPATISITALPAQPADLEPDHLLYVLFTSGSTGVPKGVVADSGNLENTMLWSLDMLDWNTADVIGCGTNFFFDISMFDVLTTFYFDIPLAIYSNPADVTRVVAETEAFRITSVFAVPTFFSQILRNGAIGDSRLSTLRRIIAGGDFFPPSHVLGWLEGAPKVEIYNVWGPTETSIVNTMHRIGEADYSLLQLGRSAPVGKRHPRMQFCLMDKSGSILDEANQRGEVCMMGACVTRGYLGDAEKTRQAYFELGGEAAFHTGDIGYVDESGELFIVGRIGSTVKVAGYRIDLGEIEAAVSTLPAVYMACACVIDLDEGLRELWLAIVPKSRDEELDIYSTKKIIRNLLPSYMVPKRIFALDSLPRNANAKIDRKAVREKLESKDRESK